MEGVFSAKEKRELRKVVIHRDKEVVSQPTSCKRPHVDLKEGCIIPVLCEHSHLVMNITPSFVCNWVVVDP